MFVIERQDVLQHSDFACIITLFRHGIRCNAVLPGIIDTQMAASVPQSAIDAVNCNLHFVKLIHTTMLFSGYL